MCGTTGLMLMILGWHYGASEQALTPDTVYWQCQAGQMQLDKLINTAIR